MISSDKQGTWDRKIKDRIRFISASKVALTQADKARE